jgi:hypothetical protein
MVMATPAQHQANQKNAARSTGPRTTAGKAASSRNAYKHGGYGSKGVAIPRGLLAEDEAEVAQFLEQVIASLAPRDALEVELAQRIAIGFLRLRRVSRFEAQSLGANAPEEENFLAADDPFVDHSPEARSAAGAARALKYTLDVVTRIEARTSHGLDRALLMYANLQRRDLAETKADVAMEIAKRTQSGEQMG